MVGIACYHYKEMSQLKSFFQNENFKMVEFPETIDEKCLQQLDHGIKPNLFCERWFLSAQYADSLYLMLDYTQVRKAKSAKLFARCMTRILSIILLQT